MPLEAVRPAVYALFSVCIATAAMDMLLRQERGALSFRAVCALAVASCALRLIAQAMGWAV